MEQTSSVGTDVSSLTTDNLNILTESLSSHIRHQRHSQRHRNNKQHASGNISSAPASSISTKPHISSALALESSSSTSSSPEMSPTPMSNLSSVSSMDDLSEMSQKSDSTPSQNHYSSSSSSLSTIVPNYNSTPRTCNLQLDQSPLLRKKSGELLKSSLRLPDLKRCQSMPNAKSVRFATNLEKVKLFEKTERPIAVSTETSPITLNNLSRRITSWQFDSDSDSEDFEELLHPEVLEKSKPWKLVSSNVRNSFSIDNSKTVQLMRIQLYKTLLTGSIFVKNLAFAKKVGIRISIDSWKSIVIIQSDYKRTVNSQFDEFEFELDITCLNFKFYERSLTMNLCVEYEVDGQIFWDNNNGANYQLVLEKINNNVSKKRSVPQLSLKMDYFNSKNLEFESDHEISYKLKPKNNRYTFDFDHDYVFDNAVLSQPNIDKLEFKNKNSSTDTITQEKVSSVSALHGNDLQNENTRPPLPDTKKTIFKSTPDFSTFNNKRTLPVRPRSTLNNEDEYHRLVRNYCYAFS